MVFEIDRRDGNTSVKLILVFQSTFGSSGNVERTSTRRHLLPERTPSKLFPVALDTTLLLLRTWYFFRLWGEGGGGVAHLHLYAAVSAAAGRKPRLYIFLREISLQNFNDAAPEFVDSPGTARPSVSPSYTPTIFMEQSRPQLLLGRPGVQRAST